MEQRVSTVLCQQTLFAAVFFAMCQVMLVSLSSSSTDLQVFTGLPTFLLPCRFHSRACLAACLPQGVADPIPLEPGNLCWDFSCSVFAQSSLLLIFSRQGIFSSFLSHQLVKICSLFGTDLVTLQVSEPY